MAKTFEGEIKAGTEVTYEAIETITYAEETIQQYMLEQEAEQIRILQLFEKEREPLSEDHIKSAIINSRFEPSGRI